MILMGMGQHEAGKVLALLDEVADVRENQIDAGQMLLCCKRHAEIDREPFAMALISEAIDRKVHADLADAAEGRKNQLLCRCHAQCPPKPRTSPAVTVATPPTCSNSSRPDSSRP